MSVSGRKKGEYGKAKKTVMYLIVLFSITLLFSSIGFTSNNSAPNFECYTCHTGASAPAAIKVTGVPKQYEPGKTYKLTVSVDCKTKSMSEVQGGFSVQASAGELIVSDKKNTQLSDSYLTHTLEGSERRSWAFEWKAPQEKVDVELKVMAIAANGDYSPFGDAITADGFTIQPKADKTSKKARSKLKEVI